ncbi:MAG: TraR/DksA C4-type zinc finger protein [Dehalococcoidales bacterium]|nr:TraR/DksA C4-type zinc finger protein [Dehalococcoidales bacterium]
MKKTEIRNILEKERKRIMEELEIRTESGPSGDRAISSYNKKIEAADQLSEQERVRAIGQRLKQQLDDIDHALEKLDKGTYGFCDICGEPIAPERLKALPNTGYCLSCKSKMSSTSRVYVT